MGQCDLNCMFCTLRPPCHVVTKVGNSGLSDGDHLITVNGLAVAQLTHEQVVEVIGSSSGVLKLHIVDAGKAQLASHHSDSSDDDYVKPRLLYLSSDCNMTESYWFFTFYIIPSHYI